MAHIRSGPAIVEIDGAVRMAVRQLGYFRPDHTAELTELIASNWRDFVSGGRFLRSHPHLFVVERKRQIGHAIRALVGQITWHVSHTVFEGTEHIWSDYCSRVELRASVKACCAASRALDGAVYARGDRISLPLPDCDAEWCSCRWMQLPDERMG